MHYQAKVVREHLRHPELKIQGKVSTAMALMKEARMAIPGVDTN
jgi:hypothetical protein